MLLQHGALAIDLPGNWLDHSTLLFLRPPDGIAAPTARIEQVPEAISLSFMRGVTAEVALLRQAEQLRALDPTMVVLRETAFPCALGAARAYEQRVTLNGRAVQQLVVACVVGEVTVLISAAASVERFPRYESELATIIKNIRPL
ncbi:MAG: hypothetical protein HY903_24705 [Deltaproteobacteria bacterium]|nr:hypothetical protein [Deltaproteobacteria bacterium]